MNNLKVHHNIRYLHYWKIKSFMMPIKHSKTENFGILKEMVV